MATPAPPALEPIPPDLARPREPLAGRRAQALLLPGLLVLAATPVLGAFGGGFEETVWYPVALFALALLVLVLVVAPPARQDRSRAFDVAAAAFGAFVVWSFLSILWADVPGDAWEGANRTLLFWLGFTIVGMRPWPAALARAALAIVAFGVGALAVGLLVVTATKSDASTLLVQGRIAEPIAYANATANLWLIAFFPALQVALSRELRMPLRALGLGTAVVLLETSLLSQSRGAAGGFVVAALAFALLHPRRWPALFALAVPVGLLALSWSTLTDVRNVADTGALDTALSDARGVIAIGAVVAIAAAVAAITGARMLERRRTPSPAARRTGDRVFLGLAGLAAVGVAVVLAGSTGWLDARWESFKSTSYDQVESGSTRFTGALGSGRYDFWRVALLEFRDHPAAGIGTENFGVPYLERRKTSEAPRYVHSIGFAILAQLGLVGAALFLAFLGGIGAGFARVRTRATSAEAGIAVAAFAGGLAWLAHGMVDWLWEFPALSLLALGLFALAGRVGGSSSGAGDVVRGPLRTMPGRAVVAIGTLAAAVSLALPGAAARFERSGYDVQRSDPETTLARLKRAADLDPLSAAPLIGRSVIARTLGRRAEARADLQEALQREPRNWFAHFELALLDGQAENWDSAQRNLREARKLNPGQPVVREVGRLLARRQAVDPAEAERALAGQLSVRLRPFDPN